MKCSELQIGDYVLVKPSMMLIKVAAVHHKKVGYHAVTHKLNWVRMDLLEPIPLTEKILERNGFKKYEEDYHNEYVCEKCDETSYYEVVICWKDSYDNGALDAFNHVQWDEGWKLDIVSEGSYNKGWCKTIYLHELQRALRLCGLNDLADNFKMEE